MHEREAEVAALIEDEVARAMTPYRSLGLPRDVLDEMESILRFGLRTHPTAQHLLRQLLDDPVLIKSDEVDTSGLVQTIPQSIPDRAGKRR